MTQTSNAGAISAAESMDDVVTVAAATAATVGLVSRAVVVVMEFTVSSKSAETSALSADRSSKCCAFQAGLVPGELDERDGGDGGDQV